MSETVAVAFLIVDGVIKEVGYTWNARAVHATGVPLTGRRDIEDAVARVVNTPVGGKENSNEEK